MTDRASALNNLGSFTLPKTGELGMIEILGPSHLPQVLELQEATRAALPEGQKNFVLPQTAAYFEKFLSRKEGVMVGVLVNERLVSQIAIMGPLTLAEAVGRHVITRNNIEFYHAGAVDSVVVAKSMAVRPDYRGNELSQHMLAALLDLPFVRAADHVFAQMSVENMRSWELFLRHGFGIVAGALDPGDHKPRFVLQRPALGFAFDMAPSADEVDPLADFAAIMRMTQKGLIGRLDESAVLSMLRLAFFADADMAMPMQLVAEAE